MARLESRHDADALAAASLLRVFHGADESLRLSARASAMAPERADLAWLHIQMCEPDDACDPAPLEKKLQELDPGNSAGWLGELVRASQRGDQAAKSVALAAIGRTERLDLYWTRLIARLSEAVADTGEFPASEAQMQVIGALAARAIPAYRHVSAACIRELPAHDERLTTCRGIARSLLNGDTVITEQVGISLASHVWPEGAPERMRALQAQRAFEEQQRYGRESGAWMLTHPDEHLSLLRQHRREQDVYAAILASIGQHPAGAQDDQ